MPYSPETMIGGVELKAAGLITASANHAAVKANRGPFSVLLAWTACEIASNDELYIVYVEANTQAAPTVWTRLGVVGVFGATEVLASSEDTAAAGSTKIGFHNPYDNEVRLATYVSGAVATGFNFSAKMYLPENMGHSF